MRQIDIAVLTKDTRKNSASNTDRVRSSADREGAEGFTKKWVGPGA